MSREVLVLVGLFAVASVAAMIRSYCFNVAGERFVARLRKKVCHYVVMATMCYLIYQGVQQYHETGDGIFRHQQVCPSMTYTHAFFIILSLSL